MTVNVEDTIREYINKSLHLSLATMSAGGPWVCEVHFAYDSDLNLYFRSTKERRHCQEIAINPNVAGNIVAQHSLEDSPHCISFEGKAELVEDETRFVEMYRFFKQRQNVTEEIIEQAKTGSGSSFYKVTIENWYAFGKFGGESNQKYKLEWNGGVQ